MMKDEVEKLSHQCYDGEESDEEKNPVGKVNLSGSIKNTQAKQCSPSKKPMFE